jgi:hypothetical protein
MKKISRSAVYESTEGRRPVALNLRVSRPKSIPVDRASLAMQLLNNQTAIPKVMVSKRHFREDPKPLDPNYPIEIELQRIALEAVPNKPPVIAKMKNTVTDEMIEKYREEERRGILQRGYDVPPEIDRRLKDIQSNLEKANAKISDLQEKYDKLNIENAALKIQKETAKTAKKSSSDFKEERKSIVEDIQKALKKLSSG